MPSPCPSTRGDRVIVFDGATDLGLTLPINLSFPGLSNSSPLTTAVDISGFSFINVSLDAVQTGPFSPGAINLPLVVDFLFRNQGTSEYERQKVIRQLVWETSITTSQNFITPVIITPNDGAIVESVRVRFWLLQTASPGAVSFTAVRLIGFQKP